MARNAKSENNIQVFRGSRPEQDVFSSNAGLGCCDDGTSVDYDKLASRVRFDNSLAHLNPTGANDKFRLPYGNGFAGVKDQIIRHINDVGVGAQISVLAIPTYAFLTGLGVHIAEEEVGLTFDVKTRNGLALPSDASYVVSAASDTECTLVRTLTGDEGGTTATDFQGIGALDGALMVDLFAKSCCGEFSLEADEIILEVASMPSSGFVTGDFDLYVSASYDIIHRAEF